jgi:hypothetical protein
MRHFILPWVLADELQAEHKAARVWNKGPGASVLISENVEWRTQAYQT